MLLFVLFIPAKSGKSFIANKYCKELPYPYQSLATLPPNCDDSPSKCDVLLVLASLQGFLLFIQTLNLFVSFLINNIY